MSKAMYDKHGKDYVKTRKEERPERVYNEHYEMPSMIKAVGNIKGKKLLDAGCGPGFHIKEYEKKGAICLGIDISKTMIEIAKENVNAELKVGKLDNLPYKNSSFDIITASLVIDYYKDLNKVFSEFSRVLKKGGLLYYSEESPIASARQSFETNNVKYKIVGTIKKGKNISGIGDSFNVRKQKWDMVPEMTMTTYVKPFRIHLKALRNNGFELLDLVDCMPTPKFKKINPEMYEIHKNNFPLFNIYVAKKK